MIFIQPLCDNILTKEVDIRVFSNVCLNITTLFYLYKLPQFLNLCNLFLQQKKYHFHLFQSYLKNCTYKRKSRTYLDWSHDVVLRSWKVFFANSWIQFSSSQFIWFNLTSSRKKKVKESIRTSIIVLNLTILVFQTVQLDLVNNYL